MSRPSLATVGLAALLSGCGGGKLNSLGPVAVGDPFTSGDAPDLPRVRIVGWLCRGETIVVSDLRRPEKCNGESNYQVAYRDNFRQYNIHVKGGVVEKIGSEYSDFWP